MHVEINVGDTFEKSSYFDPSEYVMDMMPLEK